MSRADLDILSHFRDLNKVTNHSTPIASAMTQTPSYGKSDPKEGPFFLSDA